MASIILAFFSAASAAAVAIFGKIGLEHVDSTLATTVRSVVMAVFLIIVSLFLGKLTFEGFQTIDSKALLFITLAGIAGAMSWLFYFGAIQSGTTTTVVAIDKLSIVFVVFLAALFLGEKFTLVHGLGAALMAAGAFLIALK